jgi:hypothetical protein
MSRRTVDSWRALVGGQPASGLTVSGYCAQARVCKASFYRWRRLLNAAAERPRELHAVPAATGNVPAFVDLGTLALRGERLELRVDLGGGLVLQIARG